MQIYSNIWMRMNALSFIDAQGTCIRASSSKPSSNESQYTPLPTSPRTHCSACACALYTPLLLQHLLQRVRMHLYARMRCTHASLLLQHLLQLARALVRYIHASLAALYTGLSRCNTCISAPLIFSFFLGGGSLLGAAGALYRRVSCSAAAESHELVGQQALGLLSSRDHRGALRRSRHGVWPLARSTMQ
jgi:hypothetical protein